MEVRVNRVTRANTPYSAPSSCWANDHFPSSSDNSDASSRSSEKTTWSARRDSFSRYDAAPARELMPGPRTANNDNFDYIYRKLIDAEATIRRQEIEIIRSKTDPLANHTVPDTVIDRAYQRFIHKVQQIARRICDIWDYDVTILCEAISYMKYLEVGNGGKSDTDSSGSLAYAEKWRLETVLYMPTASSGNSHRDYTKGRILLELSNLFRSHDGPPQLRDILYNLIDAGIYLAELLQEQKSIFCFQRLAGRYDPEHMDLQDPRQADWFYEDGSNAEVSVCIYPSLVKYVPLSPFICHVSKGTAIYDRLLN
ncbi:hypothetical protein BBP40_005963 [Aspergillus hancockii]|nr:hypothetical protein BBP40_005963 [Aspergillus hancockii]